MYSASFCFDLAQAEWILSSSQEAVDHVRLVLAGATFTRIFPAIPLAWTKDCQNSIFWIIAKFEGHPSQRRSKAEFNRR